MQDTSYTVRWTYTDQFGTERRDSAGGFNSPEQAKLFASTKFAMQATPDAWWIEQVTTIEFHDPTTTKEQ